MQRCLTQTEHNVFRISSCASCKKCTPCLFYIIHRFTVNSAGIKILRSLPGRANAEKVGFERQRKEAGVRPSSTTRGRSDAFCISHKLLHLSQKVLSLLPLYDLPFHSFLRSLAGRTNAEKAGFESTKGSTIGGQQAGLAFFKTGCT